MRYHFELNSLNHSPVKYGVMLGSNTVVYLKTGKGGTIFEENETQKSKYLELAHHIHAKFGYTVLVVSNPIDYDTERPLEEDLAVFDSHFPDKTIHSILYVGYSSGANYGAWLGYQIRNVEAMLLVNPILNMNFHKLKKCCSEFGDKKITIALSELDPSYKYRFLIPKRENVTVLTLTGQAHRIEPESFFQTVLDFLQSQG